MTATAPIAPGTRRFSIRLPRPLWIAMATVVLVVVAPAVAGDPADEDSDKSAALPEQAGRETFEIVRARREYVRLFKRCVAVNLRNNFPVVAALA